MSGGRYACGRVSALDYARLQLVDARDVFNARSRLGQQAIDFRQRPAAGD